MTSLINKGLADKMKAYAVSEQAQAVRYLRVSPSGLMIERLLIDMFVDGGNGEPVSISQPEIASKLNLAVETVRRVTIQLANCRRWDVIPGSGRTETTYAPLFVDSLAIDGDK